MSRSRKRGGGKTGFHRRRDALRFPFVPPEFRREAVLRNLGPWVTREYTRASNALMGIPLKDIRMKREVLPLLLELNCSVHKTFIHSFIPLLASSSV